MSHTILLPRFLEVGKNARQKIPHILKSLGCNMIQLLLWVVVVRLTVQKPLAS